jgi:hypothetical protein
VDYWADDLRRPPGGKSWTLNQRFRLFSGSQKYPSPSPTWINGQAFLNQGGFHSSWSR